MPDGQFGIATDLNLMVGFAGFVVAMHSMFFAYYAWDRGELDESLLLAVTGKSDGPPSLSELLPSEYDHIVDVDDVLGKWDESDVVAPEDRPAAAPAVPEASSDGPFDLEGMLRHDEEE